jgi:hypothetical protein
MRQPICGPGPPGRYLLPGSAEVGIDLRADAVQGEQAGGASPDKRDDELIEALKLGIEELGAPSELPQRDAGGIAGHVASAGTQRRQLGHQGSHRVPGEPCPQVIGTGHDQGPGLVEQPSRLPRPSCRASFLFSAWPGGYAFSLPGAI